MRLLIIWVPLAPSTMTTVATVIVRLCVAGIMPSAIRKPAH